MREKRATARTDIDLEWIKGGLVDTSEFGAVRADVAPTDQ